MIQLEANQTVPLVMDETGTIRVKGSRVTLDIIVSRFKQGDTAEDIQQSFPTITLGQVYAALAYYLEHESKIEVYLRERDQEADRLRQFWMGHPKSAALRQRLRALRSEKSEP